MTQKKQQKGLTFDLDSAYEDTRAESGSADRPDIKVLPLLRDNHGRILMGLSLRCYTGGENKGKIAARNADGIKIPLGVVIRIYRYDSAEATEPSSMRLFSLSEDFQHRLDWRNAQFDEDYGRKRPYVGNRTFAVDRINLEDESDPFVKIFQVIAQQIPFDASEEALDKYWVENFENQKSPANEENQGVSLGAPTQDEAPV